MRSWLPERSHRLALRQQAVDPHSGGAPSPLLSWYFWLVSAVFAFTFVENVIGRPDGIYIEEHAARFEPCSHGEEFRREVHA